MVCHQLHVTVERSEEVRRLLGRAGELLLVLTDNKHKSG